mmetsp:Transcript_25764/g.64711  ORF Transcript_25764/g.64711 Transcript_25764/m.64711 type:complete len:307 (-) Transcript_25764:212-1132(-)
MQLDAEPHRAVLSQRDAHKLRDQAPARVVLAHHRAQQCDRVAGEQLHHRVEAGSGRVAVKEVAHHGRARYVEHMLAEHVAHRGLVGDAARAVKDEVRSGRNEVAAVQAQRRRQRDDAAQSQTLEHQIHETMMQRRGVLAADHGALTRHDGQPQLQQAGQRRHLKAAHLELAAARPTADAQTQLVRERLHQLRFGHAVHHALSKIVQLLLGQRGTDLVVGLQHQLVGDELAKRRPLAKLHEEIAQGAHLDAVLAESAGEARMILRLETHAAAMQTGREGVTQCGRVVRHHQARGVVLAQPRPLASKR